MMRSLAYLAGAGGNPHRPPLTRSNPGIGRVKGEPLGPGAAPRAPIVRPAPLPPPADLHLHRGRVEVEVVDRVRPLTPVGPDVVLARRVQQEPGVRIGEVLPDRKST